MPLTRGRTGLKALMLRHEQAPNTGPANRRLEQTFRFVDLPFDVRLMVYDICVTAPSCIVICHHALHNPPNEGPVFQAMGPESERSIELHGRTGPKWRSCCIDARITYTCKLVYEEAIPIIYGRNRFFFPHNHMSITCNTFAEFTSRLSDVPLTQLRKLILNLPRLRGQNTCPYEAQFRLSLIAIRKFERLESLHIFGRDYFLSSDLSILGMIDRSRGNAKVVLEVCANESCYTVLGERGENFDIIAEVEMWGW